MASLPTPRGPISEWMLTTLHRGGVTTAPPHIDVADPRIDDDLHLALYCAYELHYRGFDGVDEALEWNPALLRVRARLEAAFEDALRAEAREDGPSLSRWMLEHGELEHMREFCIHRSAYQLKEADPHTFGIPRLEGVAKAAMVAIQADEYGEGRPEAMHSTLFADTMRALGLDATYGAYLEQLPGTTLATCNLVTMFGLHRRMRAALVGHLALFEMTSVEPMGRYAAALRRFGLGGEATRFYDVHVEADAVHEVIAERDLVGGFLRAEPSQRAEVDFGMTALTNVERRFAQHLLESWESGRRSLAA